MRDERSHREEMRLRVYDEEEGRCAICGTFVRHREMYLDYMVPLSKGGKDCIHNVQLTHARCRLRGATTSPTDAPPCECDVTTSSMLRYLDVEEPKPEPRPSTRRRSTEPEPRVGQLRAHATNLEPFHVQRYVGNGEWVRVGEEEEKKALGLWLQPVYKMLFEKILEDEAREQRQREQAGGESIDPA